MSDKAETVTCHLCGDTGTVHFKGGDEDCAACYARMVLDTGVTTTGETKPTIELFLLDTGGQWVASVHADRRSAPAFVRFGSSHYQRRGRVGTRDQWQYNYNQVVVTAQEAASAFDADASCEVVRVERPDDRYIKPALGHGASGMAFSLDDARDRIERRDATIAEQAAEIERLKHDVDALKFDTGTLTTDRDRLRLEVQRLNDLNFEAQDRYAALEAERDEARRASETVHSHYVLALKQRDEAVANTRAECDKGYEALFQAHQRMFVNVVSSIVQRMENSTHD